MSPSELWAWALVLLSGSWLLSSPPLLCWEHRIVKCHRSCPREYERDGTQARALLGQVGFGEHNWPLFLY